MERNKELIQNDLSEARVISCIEAIYNSDSGIFIAWSGKELIDSIRSWVIADIDCQSLDIELREIWLSYRQVCKYLIAWDRTTINKDLKDQISYDYGEIKKSIQEFIWVLRVNIKKTFFELNEEFDESEVLTIISNIRLFYDTIWVNTTYRSDIWDQFSKNIRLHHDNELQKLFVHEFKCMRITLLELIEEWLDDSDLKKTPTNDSRVLAIKQKIDDMKDYVVSVMSNEWLSQSDCDHFSKTISINYRLDDEI